jgi:hypothetical protein
MKASVCQACGGQEAVTETGSYLGGNDLGLEIEGTIEKCVLCMLIDIPAQTLVSILGGAV